MTEYIKEIDRLEIEIHVACVEREYKKALDLERELKEVYHLIDEERRYA